MLLRKRNLHVYEKLQVQFNPTAIFAVNDEVAYGAIKTIQEQKLNIPEDISIIGFGGPVRSVDLLNLRLSSVIQPSYEMVEEESSCVKKSG